MQDEASGYGEVSEAQLRRWHAQGVFGALDSAPKPNARSGRYYSFSDLLALRLLRQLPKEMVERELAKVQGWIGARTPDEWRRAMLTVAKGRVAFEPADDGIADSDTVVPIAPVVDALYRDIEVRRSRKPEDIGRITSTPNVLFGKPAIAGTRIPTYIIWEWHEDGYDEQHIVEQYLGIET